MADTTKYRQENAVYAFTIVTVIFLPLSAVSSIFGMNTSDMRDLTQTQWLYWATAIPVTVGVILLGLLWTGELGNVLRWMFWGVARWMVRRLLLLVVKDRDRAEGRRVVEGWLKDDERGDRNSDDGYVSQGESIDVRRHVRTRNNRRGNRRSGLYA